MTGPPSAAGSQGMSSSSTTSTGKKARKDRSITCSYCSMTFNKKEHLQRHERTHTLDRPYACDHPGCGKTFARRDTLTRHTRLHQRDDGPAGSDSAEAAPPTLAAQPSSSSSKATKKRRTRTGSAGSGTGISASESEFNTSNASNGTAGSSVAPLSGGSGSTDSMDDGTGQLGVKPKASASPLLVDELKKEPADADTEMEVLNLEQPTPSGLRTASVLYGLALDQYKPPSSSSDSKDSAIPSLVGAMPPAFAPNTDSRPYAFAPATTAALSAVAPAPTSSSLGLDIEMPQHPFQSTVSSTLAPGTDNHSAVIPSFVQAAQERFQFFPDSQGQQGQGQPHAAAGYSQAPHQRHPSQSGQPDQQQQYRNHHHSHHLQQQPAQHPPRPLHQQVHPQPAIAAAAAVPSLPGGHPAPGTAITAVPATTAASHGAQSFLASNAGSPYSPEFFQLRDLMSASQRCYSPDDRPQSSTSDSSFLYHSSTGSASEPSSVLSSAHSLPSALPLPSTSFHAESYDAYFYRSAFKPQSYFVQPSMTAQSYVDAKLDLLQADRTADEFLQWPPRGDSPSSSPFPVHHAHSHSHSHSHARHHSYSHAQSLSQSHSHSFAQHTRSHSLAPFGLSPDNSASTMSSNSPSASASSWMDLSDYEPAMTQSQSSAPASASASWFAAAGPADKTMTALEAGPESPAASLEEWMLRQPPHSIGIDILPTDDWASPL